MLIHCGAGMGRTGTLVTCVLMALGTTVDEAYKAAGEAGSHPEKEPQKALARWVADCLDESKTSE